MYFHRRDCWSWWFAFTLLSLFAEIGKLLPRGGVIVIPEHNTFPVGIGNEAISEFAGFW